MRLDHLLSKGKKKPEVSKNQSFLRTEGFSGRKKLSSSSRGCFTVQELRETLFLETAGGDAFR